MAIRIAPEHIHNLQQMEVGVAGPEGATRLFIITGQFDPTTHATVESGPR